MAESAPSKHGWLRWLRRGPVNRSTGCVKGGDDEHRNEDADRPATPRIVSCRRPHALVSGNFGLRHHIKCSPRAYGRRTISITQRDSLRSGAERYIDQFSLAPAVRVKRPVTNHLSRRKRIPNLIGKLASTATDTGRL